VNTFNRVLWIVVGTLLTAAGVVGVLANVGVMPGLNRDRDVITSSMDDRWRSWGGWATAVTIIVGLVIAILGVLLLRVQFLRRGGASMANLTRPGLLPSTSDESVREAGRTRVAVSTLNDALTRDLRGDGHIRWAAVRLSGEPRRPQLRMRLGVTPDADLAELRRHVDRAVRRFSTTSGLRPDIAEVTVKMSGQARQRAH
jgi:hypothetical protein